MKNRIYDWAGNHCFKDKSFKSFHDAWDFLFEKFPDDETGDLQEYEVLPDHLKPIQCR